MLAVAFLLAVVASALFAGLETGMYTTSRLRLYLDGRAGVRAATRALNMLRDMPGLLAVLLVANNLANQSATFLAQLLLVQWEVPSRELVGSLGVTVILFLFGESVPKNAYRRRRERLLYPTLPALVVARVVLAPIARPVAAVARVLERAVRRRTEEQVSAGAGGEADMLSTGADEGLLTDFQERVARGVLDMRSRTADDEAEPLEAHPIARIGRAGVEMPKGCREHRVLVLDGSGDECLGWVPLASLWTADGFRAPSRAQVRPVTAVLPSLALDSLYVTLDRTGSPFALVRRPDGLRVLAAEHLRERVMGRFGEETSADEAVA